MFTGLVESMGEVVLVKPEPPGVLLGIRPFRLGVLPAIGQSVAVNGCCLTVVESKDAVMHFEAGEETLKRTTLGSLRPGHWVNLELPLRLGDFVGGHIVTGHVDGIGALIERRDEGSWSTCWFSAPEELARHMAAKGSIAVDGVSLTLVAVRRDRFSVALIPHTLEVTTLGRVAEGDQVNLETDVLAKYVQRLLFPNS